MRCLKILFVSLQLGLASLGCLYASPILAQVTSDGTVNTQVNQNGNVAEITGGETRGGNLFHSFQDFSVQTGNEAFFNNANEISNILSRVTGGNISNIDGLIRANGSASLFLINPAGIIFGENASLDIGGSFYSSTASSILFEDGEFSAVDNLQQPLLTINAPIGLSFRDNPGEIINRSRVENSSGVITGLEISSGNNLAFVGGDLNFESGNATARGGNIYLGGLGSAGIVNLNQDGSLSFPDDLNKANITLTNAADVDVVGTGGGNITVDGNNLSLAGGELGRSLIRGGISSNSTNPQAIAGDVTINVAENISLNESRILNRVDPEGIGNAGNITVNTGSIELINGGQVNASTFGEGNAGVIKITATGDLTADGLDSEGVATGIGSVVDPNATGDSEGITISTTNLKLTNGGAVDATTFGQGNAGAIKITATGDITVDGFDSEGFQSGIASVVAPGATGDAGGVTISTTNLNLTNGGRVDASTTGQGNAGVIKITATGDLTADGLDSEGVATGIGSVVDPNATGDSEGITISTTNLSLTNGGLVITSTFGEGDAGNLTVTAEESIELVGSDGVSPSGLFANTIQGNGDGGNLTIATDELIVRDEAVITVGNFQELIEGSLEPLPPGTGAAGNLEINAGSVEVNNQGKITADNASGIGGELRLNADSLTIENGASISASTTAEQGRGGILTLDIDGTLRMRDNSLISARAFNNADGGNLSIDARFIVAFPDNGTGNDLVATAEGGTGGNINLNVEQLFGLQPRQAIGPEGNFFSNNSNDLDVSGSIAGEINININNVDPLRGTTELPNNLVEPGETVAQACQRDSIAENQSGLTLEGKGGIPPAPGLPLDSRNIIVSDQANPQSTIPAPIETAQGKIQPARGVKVTESGEIILTAYRTNNRGERIPESSINCGQI